jgi:hypothetical protein
MSLGNIIEFLIDANHPKYVNQDPTDIPRYMPLQLAIMGMSFSGKKKVAEFLKEKYHLDVITKEGLITWARDYVVVPEEDPE